MQTLDLFGAGGPQTLGPIVQALSTFVQQHFKTAYEIVMAPKDFVLNTHYNGTSLCKFQSNSYTLAIYETPAKVSLLDFREIRLILESFSTISTAPEKSTSTSSLSTTSSVCHQFPSTSSNSPDLPTPPPEDSVDPLDLSPAALLEDSSDAKTLQNVCKWNHCLL